MKPKKKETAFRSLREFKAACFPKQLAEEDAARKREQERRFKPYCPKRGRPGEPWAPGGSLLLTNP